MPAPLLYLDECVPEALAPALRKRGFFVASAQEHGMGGQQDREQLLYATSLGCVLVTHNTRHFMALHVDFLAQNRPHSGIITLPQHSPIAVRELRIAMTADWIALTAPNPRSRLFAWGHLQRWLESGERVPGYTEDDVRRALGR